MDRIRLVEPTEDYAEDLWAFRQEILEKDEADEDQFAGAFSLDTSSTPKEWIDICRYRKEQDTCEETGVSVPSHSFLAVRESDGKIVGVIDLRHHIDHPILGTWGGHCGYSVRPTERGKGYAKEMLRLNLQKAKELGITRFLVTCNVENKASEQVILANGGVFENTADAYGNTVKRYWIELM